jgi:tRNA (mo5U34)-methyltransferase
MSTESLEDKINAMPYWYHKIELPGGIVTPGWAPLSVEAYGIPEDLTGKRVLDIGAWDGYWTFEALKRGASEVVAIDDFSDYLGSLGEEQRRAWETFDICRDAFGYNDKKCQRYDMNVYDITEEKLGRFDIVFLFGTLYHMRYPLLCLDKVSSVCDGEIYIESAILDDHSAYKGGLGKGYNQDDVVMEFYPNNEYGNNDSNWWTPTLKCMAALVNAAGFKKGEGWKLHPNPSQLALCRGFIRATKAQDVPESWQQQEEQAQQGSSSGK